MIALLSDIALSRRERGAMRAAYGAKKAMNDPAPKYIALFRAAQNKLPMYSGAGLGRQKNPRAIELPEWLARSHRARS